MERQHSEENERISFEKEPIRIRGTDNIYDKPTLPKQKKNKKESM